MPRRGYRRVSRGEGSRNVASDSHSNQYEQLCVAALMGNVKVLHDVMKSNPLILRGLISSDHNTGTPLYWAIKGGQLEFCRVLMQNCPELALVSDDDDGTPLHMVVARGQCDIVRLLLSYGHHDICFVRDRHGMMPIHLAVIEGKHWVLHEMLHHEHFHHHGGVSRERHCTDFLCKTVNGDSAIRLCIKYDQLKALKLLVDYCLSNNCGAVLKCKDQYGNSLSRMAEILGRDKIKHYLLHRLNRRRGETKNQLWYRKMIFKAFEYDEEWIREMGEKVQTMTTIALGACFTILVCILGFKDTELVDGHIHAHRSYLLDSIGACLVFGLPMIFIYLVGGLHLWRNNVWRTLMIVCLGGITICMGISLIQILSLASITYENSYDVSMYI